MTSPQPELETFVKMRRSSAVWGVIGLVLIALAALTRFVVTPYMAQLPSDTDVTVTYTGTEIGRASCRERV